MEIIVLAVKETHGDYQECPMRLAWHPSWQCWYCVDCGLAILNKRIEVKEKDACVAQSVEQISRKDQVPGSTPGVGFWKNNE